MHAPLAVIWRLLAFVGKELIETIRRPGALVSLVLGPFLIMAVFGAGLQRRAPTARDARSWSPARAGCRPTTATIPAARRRRPLHIAEVTQRPGHGRGSAARGRASTSSWSPRRTRKRRSERASVGHRGPRRSDRPGRGELRERPRRIRSPTPSTSSSSSGRSRRARATSSRPASQRRRPSRRTSSRLPQRRELTNLAPTTPTVTSFFGPAVLALILQHLAVTLVSMSLVRERESGVMELFRISPVTAAEVIAGKVLAFGILGVRRRGLDRDPARRRIGRAVLAEPGYLALAIGLLLLASLGLGLLIAVVSDSERQAVQLSLLVLLASVFFSGFVLAIDRVHAAGPRAGVRAAGHPRDPASPGLHAARLDDAPVAGRRARCHRAGHARRWRGWVCVGG